MSDTPSAPNVTDRLSTSARRARVRAPASLPALAAGAPRSLTLTEGRVTLMCVYTKETPSFSVLQSAGCTRTGVAHGQRHRPVAFGRSSLRCAASVPEVARRTQKHIYIVILRSFLSLLGWIPMGIGVTFVVLKDGCGGHNLAPDRSLNWLAAHATQVPLAGRRNIYILLSCGPSSPELRAVVAWVDSDGDMCDLCWL